MFVFIPLIQMRKDPSLNSEVVSQSFFSEEIEILSQKGKWSFIQTSDGYQGWTQEKGFVEIDYQPNIETSRLISHVYLEKGIKKGPWMSLPFGSRLKKIRDEDERWALILLPDGKKAYIQRGDFAKEPFDLLSFSRRFLGLPYTWGGRTSFGFDCSGFVQMLYLQMGIQLPRDSKDQFLVGEKIEKEELQISDLIFWGSDKDQIQHVGMYLKEGMFIHTSCQENQPYLRVSSLRDPFWNRERGYPFRAFKRLSGQCPEKDQSACNFCS